MSRFAWISAIGSFGAKALIGTSAVATANHFLDNPIGAGISEIAKGPIGAIEEAQATLESVDAVNQGEMRFGGLIGLGIALASALGLDGVKEWLEGQYEDIHNRVQDRAREVAESGDMSGGQAGALAATVGIGAGAAYGIPYALNKFRGGPDNSGTTPPPNNNGPDSGRGGNNPPTRTPPASPMAMSPDDVNDATRSAANSSHAPSKVATGGSLRQTFMSNMRGQLSDLQDTALGRTKIGKALRVALVAGGIVTGTAAAADGTTTGENAPSATSQFADAVTDMIPGVDIAKDVIAGDMESAAENTAGLAGGVLGAAFAGAAAGTVVGGPVGTVAGLAIGVGGYFLGDMAGRGISGLFNREASNTVAAPQPVRLEPTTADMLKQSANYNRPPVGMTLEAS